MPVEPWSAAAVALAACALLVGLSKTSAPGVAALAVAVFASVLPAKESTAAVLLLLLMGDVVAVARYRHDCHWPLLRRLLPSVLPGVALGAAFLAVVDDVVLRRVIGGMLLVMMLWQMVGRLRQGTAPQVQESTPEDRAGADVRTPSRLTGLAAGTAAGFTTMTANAAGPVMTAYLLAARVDKTAFVGTNAWFFLMVNLCKTPFSYALGLFPQSTLVLTLALAPFVLVGAWLGLRVLRLLPQRLFDQLALAASALGALLLLLR